MGKNKKDKAKGQISQYLKWPIYFNMFWIVITVVTYIIDIKAGLFMTAAEIIYIVITVTIYLRFRPNIMRKLVDFGAEYSQVQRQMIHEMEIPYGLIEETGKVLWTNAELDNMVQGKNIRNKLISSVFEDFKEEYLEFEENGRNEFRIEYEGCVYKVVLKIFTLRDSISEHQMELFEENSGSLISMYMFDETKILQLTKENREERLVTGHIYIDNYDEVLQSIEATRRTLLVALIDRKINKYFSQYDGIVRKLENDKYFVIFKTKYISKMQTDKFSVLDEVKTVNIGNGLPITISIGVGTGGNGLVENYDLAGTAIDMALGRGGDQAVLKDGNKVYYYGGKSKSVEKNTKVKSRVKATAFRDLIETKETLYIMGHHIGDNDSFGAAIGFYRIGKTIGKDVHIVLGEVSSSVLPLVNAFREMEIYDEDMFLSGPEAAAKMTKNDALIVVDCSRAGYTEYPELVRRAQCLLVFDHHRQTTDVIDNAQLSYIELSSSSTCEMVVEIMQYINETVKLTKLEAEAIYGGIMIDTNNFTNRTGVRTFEAAAYLKKNGADITKVRRMFRDDISDYKAKATAIQNTEIYMNEYAISVCRATNVSSPTVVGAQAANELLNVKNVKASFVCTPYNDQIYISARSIDKVNVQLIMEEFGGGGHMNLAGAQVRDKSVSEVILILKQIISQRLQEGEI
ncbi:MAG: DHH family phosphoesterase [Eubacterium sp.]